MIARLRWFAAGAVAAIVAAVMLGAVTSGKLWTWPEDQQARAAIEEELRQAKEKLAAQGFMAPTIGPVNIPNLPQGAVAASTHAGTVPFGPPLPRPGPGKESAGPPPPDRDRPGPGQLPPDPLQTSALARGCRPCEGWLCPEDLACSPRVNRTIVAEHPMEQLLCAASVRLPDGLIVARGEELASQNEVFEAREPAKPTRPAPRTLIGPNIGAVMKPRGAGYKVGLTYAPRRLAFSGKVTEGRIFFDAQWVNVAGDPSVEATAHFVFGVGEH